MNDSARERIFPFEIKKTEGKSALVVGGAGFLGSYICDQLISHDFSVFCVDNLTSGGKENVKQLLSNPNFSLIKADVNTPGFNIPEEVGIDIIFHAAGLEEFSVDKDLSLETLLVNSLGTRVLLEIARTKKSKFVFVSSADLYSGVFSSTSLKYYFGKDPRNESTFTHNEAKRFAEALVFEYFKNYDLDASVVRVKDVYGPRMNLQAEGELSRLVGEVVSGKKMSIFGDGLKTVNPTFVLDVAAGVVKAGLVGSKGEIYNLVNPEKITLNALTQIIRQVVGHVEVVHRGASEDLEAPYHQLDLSTSYERLDWRPSVRLADGISLTINHFRQNQSKEGEDTKVTQPLFMEKTPTKAGQNKKKRKRLPLFSHLRLVIFLAALALVLITIVYPGAALVFNTYQANRSFKSAIQNLEVDKVTESASQSQRAESSYRRAAQNLQNLNWLLQIFTERGKLNALGDFYLVGEKFSEATASTSEALEILIEQTSNGTNMSNSQVQDYILQINETTLEAKADFNLGSAALSSMESEKLPNSLKDDLEIMEEGEVLLGGLIEELSTSTAP
jgi:nucleoside-diphosphate-sugar epimerase